MAPDIGWDPLGQKGRYAAKRAAKASGPRVDFALMALVIVALLAIGYAIYLLDTYPGILNVVKSLAAAVWDMLGNVAAACQRFADFVRQQI